MVSQFKGLNISICKFLGSVYFVPLGKSYASGILFSV